MAPVDDRDVDVTLELHARRVGGVHRLDVALAARGGRGAAVGAQVHVARAPRVEVVERERALEGEALGHHLGRLLPAADLRVEVEELGRGDHPGAQRLEPVLDADVVPRDPGVAVVAGAVDVAGVVPVGPLDALRPLGQLVEVVDVGERRVQREGRQPEPARLALHQRGGRRGRVTVHHLVAEGGVQRVQPVPLLDLARGEVLREVGAVQPDDRLAHLGIAPLRVVAVGGVEVVLEQLAVAHVDRLGDHVRVRVLGDGRVDEASVVLGVDVLLDGATRAADRDRVVGHAVRLDRQLLEHQRRLAAHLQVVMGAGAGAARPHDAVALAEQVGRQHGAGAGGALVVADADPALEAEHQAAVPQRVVGGGRVGLADRGQHGDAVDEPVDGAALPAHDERNGLAVHRRGGGDVCRRRGGVVEPVEGAVGGRPVEVAVAGVGGAVLAPADDRRIGGGVAPAVLRVAAVGRLGRDGDADALLVVDDRLAEHGTTVEPAAGGGADERLLLRPGEDGSATRVVDEGELGRPGQSAPAAGSPPAGCLDPQDVVALGETVDQADERAVALGVGERRGDVGAVDRDLHLRGVHPARDRDLDEGVTARDLLWRSGQHGDLEPLAPTAVGGTRPRPGAGERGGQGDHARGRCQRANGAATPETGPPLRCVVAHVVPLRVDRPSRATRSATYR